MHLRNDEPVAAEKRLVDVPASTRCTRMRDGDGLTGAYVLADAPPALTMGATATEARWKSKALTLADCKPGDRVYADIGTNIGFGGTYWPLFEVVEV
jgi:hypothetical protein